MTKKLWLIALVIWITAGCVMLIEPLRTIDVVWVSNADEGHLEVSLQNTGLFSILLGRPARYMDDSSGVVYGSPGIVVGDGEVFEVDGYLMPSRSIARLIIPARFTNVSASRVRLEYRVLWLTRVLVIAWVASNTMIS